MKPKTVKEIEYSIIIAAILASIVAVYFIAGCACWEPLVPLGVYHINAEIHGVDELPATCPGESYDGFQYLGHEKETRGCAHRSGKIYVLRGFQQDVWKTIGHEIAHLMHWIDGEWPDPDGN